MRLAKNPLEEGVRCDLSGQNVEFKKTSGNPNYGHKNSIDSPLQ
jgi:hypothetical protein